MLIRLKKEDTTVYFLSEIINNNVFCTWSCCVDLTYSVDEAGGVFIRKILNNNQLKLLYNVDIGQSCHLFSS